MEFVALLPTMLTLRTSESDEPLFAPRLMWRPTRTFFIETSATSVSRPPSIETPFATPLPSMIPPLSQYQLPASQMLFAGWIAPRRTIASTFVHPGAALNLAKAERRKETLFEG